MENNNPLQIERTQRSNELPPSVEGKGESFIYHLNGEMSGGECEALRKMYS